jgi:6-phosphogluconolactonase
MTEESLLVFKDIDEISGYVADRWLEISVNAINKNGLFTVALSGGRTPLTLHKKLVESKDLCRWDKTHIFLVDERFVPYDDIESNFKMIRETLLDLVRIPAENIHPIPVEEDAGASASKYEEEIRSFFSLDDASFPKFDLVLLGIGGDGHTASLFTGTPALDEKGRLATAVRAGDSIKQERITMTLPVINNAENIFFMASGTGKAKVIKAVIEDKGCGLPAAMVRPESGGPVFLIDESAGSLLTDIQKGYRRLSWQK